MSRVRKVIDGKAVWFDSHSGKQLKDSELTKHDLEADSFKPAFIHQDTILGGLMHPVTGKVVESMTEWNRINKQHGLECVGNDLLSKRKREVKDKVTDERLMDAIYKAESIMSDPAKKREWDNQQEARFEKHNAIFKGQHRYQ